MGIEKKTGVPLKGGDEHDALTRFRRLLAWHPGQRNAAKTSFNRRLRHQRVEVDDDAPPELPPAAP